MLSAAAIILGLDLTTIIDHFTVVCLVTLPMNASKAGRDLACFDEDLCHLNASVVSVRTC